MEIDGAQAPDGGRPEILLMPGQMPRIIDEAEKVLVANAPQFHIFQRGGENSTRISRAEVERIARDGFER
jgi:hypothetical protein